MARPSNTKRVALVSWAFIWYGVIFSAQSDPTVHDFGLAFWGVGVLLQLAIGISFLRGSVATDRQPVSPPHPQ
jgi:hypothetical protein